MALSIKDDRADELARRLAALTGESLTAAVTTAIQERLEKLERLRSQERLLADVHAIAQKFRKHVDQPFTSTDHGDLLYDEFGLPR